MQEPIDDQLFKRLVLMNQYKLLEALDEDNADEWRRAFDNTQQHRPIDELPFVDVLRDYARNPFTSANRSELFDVLDLFDTLQRAEDSGLTASGEITSTAFPGFDGNHETSFLAYYQDLVAEGRRWTGCGARPTVI